MKNKEVAHLHRPSRRYGLSTVLLLAALVLSIIQYVQKNEVTWITDSFRFIEATGENVLGPNNTYFLAGKYKEFKAKAIRSIDDVSNTIAQPNLTSGDLARNLAAVGNGISGSVVGVTDGDTIKVLDANRVLYKVRLTGIDAPEQGQPYGGASAQNLAAILSGKDVLIASSGEDEYGRVLGKVLLSGKDINLEQVKAGYAWWYRYYAEQQSGADQKAYEQAESTARAQRWGLWADPQPINPYEWRKRRK